MAVSDIRPEKRDADLAFVVKGSVESVKVKGFFDDARLIAAYCKLDAVKFGDGTTWDRAELLAQQMVLTGGDGHDALIGHEVPDIFVVDPNQGKESSGRAVAGEPAGCRISVPRELAVPTCGAFWLRISVRDPGCRRRPAGTKLAPWSGNDAPSPPCSPT